MTRHKPRGDDTALFGTAGARPEWELRREDERRRETEKTQRLRAARLAAATPRRQNSQRSR